LLLAQIKENSPFERSTPWGGDEAAKLAYLACLLFALGCAARATSKGVRMTVAVNLSMANLLDLDLVDTINRLLTAHRVPPEQLILEITRGAFANDWSRSRKTVFALRRLGVRISLDDYGTGWSSLARLQDMSVDELKLDRVFVRLPPG
jgi:diguanylate cyclase